MFKIYKVKKMNIGLVGLGSMGLNLAKNIISKKYKVYAYEKNEKIIHEIRALPQVARVNPINFEQN